MAHLKIQGNARLVGEIAISGAKNSALPLMVASLLTDKMITLNNFPILTDTLSLVDILKELGGEAEIIKNDNPKHGSPHQLNIKVANIASMLAVHEAVNQMRASILVLGPLLAREGGASVTLPGGDAIGARPINLHLQGLKLMGANIDIVDGKVHTNAPRAGLHGARIKFPFISVGATEHLMLSAALAKGETVLQNAALEPEIIDLANLLKKMGVAIEGAGTSQIHIQGGMHFKQASHDIIADRIEASSFAIAAIATKGDLKLTHIDTNLIQKLLTILTAGGAEISLGVNSFRIKGDPKTFKCQKITTGAYPDFPTDVQAQMMALLCLVAGESEINELIFENRFMHVPQYQNMGADIKIENSKAVIHGVAKLMGSDIAASDIRACLGLVIAALVADGETILRHIYHLDRGYEAFEEKLSAVGAKLQRFA